PGIGVGVASYACHTRPKCPRTRLGSCRWTWDTGTCARHILSETSHSSALLRQIPTSACLPKNGPFGRSSKPYTRVSRAPEVYLLLARGYGAHTTAFRRFVLTTLSAICRSHRLAQLVFIVSSVAVLVPAWLRAHANARNCRFSPRFTRWRWPLTTPGP